MNLSRRVATGVALRLLRGAVATVAGVLAAGACIAGVEWLGHQAYPPPPELRLDDASSIAQHIAGLPAGALLWVLAAWLVGTFVGGVVAVWIAQRRPRLYAGVLAAVVLLGALSNFAMIPHPAWFMALSLVGLPLAGFAAQAASQRLLLRPTTTGAGAER